MPQQRRVRPMLRVRSFSKLPESLSSTEGVLTPTPPFLEGDDTAFAFYMPEDSIIAGMRGVLLYATKRRDPVEEDCVMFVMKNGSLHVRIIMEIHSDHFSTLRLTSRDSMRSAKEKIKFDQISEMAVVAGTCRISG